MTDLEKLIAWFKEQVGTQEHRENDVPYNTHYYGREVSGPDYPWCMAFIWDGFQRCGLSGLFIGGGKSAYCPHVVQWAREHGRWVTDEYRAGDLLFYDWNNDGQADHVGFCTGSSNGRVDSVEGNVSDAVCVTHCLPGTVMGAYRPEYEGEAGGDTADDTFLPLIRRGNVVGAVLSIQVLLIYKWRISCGVDGADGDFGPNTENAVKAFQRHFGLEEDGIVGPATLKKILS